MLVSCMICVALLLDKHKELTGRCHALNLVFILMLYGTISPALRRLTWLCAGLSMYVSGECDASFNRLKAVNLISMRVI